ncbi:MAG: DUF6798 domain-containing protein [Cytophagales bacterium]|nr:DUF6798 domain-containing protein [Cytophagales bacterium]
MLIFITLVSAVLIIFPDYIPVKYINNKHYGHKNELTYMQKMHIWIRQNTPVEASILTDPMNESFACEAHRSQPCNLKAVIHTPYYYKKWYHLLKLCYGVDILQYENTQFKHILSDKFYDTLAIHPDSVDYILTQNDRCKYMHTLPVVKTIGNVSLLKY